MVPGFPALLAPVRYDRVLFRSMDGRYSDSPRALSEGLASRDTTLRRTWALTSHAPLAADRTDVVRPGSSGYFATLHRAGAIVANAHLPRYFRKRAGVVYLQTWHGTPLKRIGFDISAPRFQTKEAFHRAVAGDVAKWDFLVSPNQFSTDIFRRSFRYDGPILETGYPRNDVLSAASDERVHELRRRLHIPEHTKVALYMPTWRDVDLARAGVQVELPFREDRLPAAFARDWVLLVRAHSLVRFPPTGSHGVLRDVSAWEDAAELYQVADVLITDYSSSMFDFAVTRRPMIFFAYDLERYRDETRGFYFDFETEAPGPILRTPNDVIECLLAGTASGPAYEERYAAFVERYCSLEDGRASQRVLDALLEALAGRGWAPPRYGFQ